MYRMLFLIAMFAVLFLAQTLAQTSEKQRYCSDRLNDELMKVCDGFNGYTAQKRGMIASDLEPLDPIQYVEITEANPLFRGRFNVGGGVLNSLAPIRRLTRQGIVDMCCKVPCYPSVLELYCSI